jgi:hypothetical protein
MPIKLRAVRRSAAPKSPKRTFAFGIDKGMWTSGDPMKTPDGYFRLGRNLFLRAGRLELRPQFTYDNLTNVRGLANWDDDANRVTRLVAIDSAGALKAKGTSGETWGSAATGTVGGTRLLSAATYRGKLYGMQGDSSDVPSAAFSYDGSAIDTTPFTSTIYARAILAHVERLWLFYPRVTVTPLVRSNAIAALYDYTRNGWFQGATNVTATLLTSGSVVTSRLVPTSTSNNACEIYAYHAGTTVLASPTGLFEVSASDTDTTYVARWPIRPVHASFRVPLTLELHAIGLGPQIDPYSAALGFCLVRSGYIFRVTTAGSTTGAEPSWTTTIGGTSTWGTAVFTNVGSSVLASKEIDEFPSATDSPDVQTYWLRFKVPSGDGLSVTPYIKFYTTKRPACTTLAPIDVAMKDGLADGTEGKSNFALQITKGDFYYPFFNTETATSATIDMPEIAWSEPGQPERIRAENTYNLTGVPSYPTAAAVVGGKIVSFKRRAFQVFGIDPNDADNPLVAEGEERPGVGCLNPQALDTLDDWLYFAGENEVYRFRPGDSPQPLCGDAMKELIFAKGSGWVESQSAPANRFLLAIDKKERELWIYPQKGLLYVYSIDRNGWSGPFEAGMGTGTAGYEICAMTWNANTGLMEFAFSTAAAGTAGLARLDPSQAVAEDSISSSGTLPVRWDFWLRPLELATPFYELLVEKIRMKLKVTASQTGQTFTAYVSKDQGVTWPKSNQVVIDPVSTGEYRRGHISLWQKGESLMLRLLHIGKGGATNGAISHVEADVQLIGGEYPNDNFTAGSASL